MELVLKNMKIAIQSNKQFHFRDQLDLLNLISTLRAMFPELHNIFEEYKESDPNFELTYLILGNSIFLPFLIDFINSQPKEPLLGKRLFHFLEKMARSADWEVRNILAVSILESLEPRQLQIAQEYMGPKTKETLKNLKEYLEKLLQKK